MAARPVCWLVGACSSGGHSRGVSTGTAFFLIGPKRTGRGLRQRGGQFTQTAEFPATCLLPRPSHTTRWGTALRGETRVTRSQSPASPAPSCTEARSARSPARTEGSFCCPMVGAPGLGFQRPGYRPPQSRLPGPGGGCSAHAGRPRKAIPGRSGTAQCPSCAQTCGRRPWPAGGCRTPCPQSRREPQGPGSEGWAVRPRQTDGQASPS